VKIWNEQKLLPNVLGVLKQMWAVGIGNLDNEHTNNNLVLAPRSQLKVRPCSPVRQDVARRFV
jgi:hypothetical protein